LKADLSDQKNLRETMDGLLSKAKEELAELTLCYAEKEKEFADHQLTIQQLQEENQKLSDELTALTNHKLELETRSISRQDYDELEGKLQTLSGFTDFMLMVLDLCLSLSLSMSLSVSLCLSPSLSLPLSLSLSLSLSTGEKNHYQQMTQSLGKELKRVMRSSQQEVTALTNDLSSQKEMYEVRIVFVFLAPLSLTHSLSSASDGTIQ
jgi:exonuclease VII large subunit